MNRHLVAVNVLIVLSAGLAVIYAMPNFFREAPAIQVSSATSIQKVDIETLRRVQTLLEHAKVANNVISLDGASLIVRLPDTGCLLKAKDLLQAGLGSDYAVALNPVSR